MKTQLMAGTALAAAAMLVAGGALAADKKMMKPSISVNGYYEGVVGGLLGDSQEKTYTYMGVDVDGTDAVTWTDPAAATVVALPMGKMSTKKDTSALDTRTDAEVHFNGRATLDSGIKIHTRWELEGQYNHSTGDPIDEYFLSLAGSFGQIILGGTEGAAVKMLTGFSGSWATGVGESLSFDDAWIPTASAGANFEVLRHSRLSTGDGEKISYLSPKLGGFQIGVSYEPRVSNNDDNSRVDAEMDRHDALHGAASFSGKFGEVGFGGGFGVLNAQAANMDGAEDYKAWIAAARLDFGPARIAAAYKRTSDPTAMRGQLVDLGVRYTAGANSFSLTGMQGEMKDTDESHTKVMASYARGLGPGVKVHANIIWNESQSMTMMGGQYALNGDERPDGDTNDYMQQSSEQKNSGMALVTGIRVSF